MKRIPVRAEATVEELSSTHRPESATTNDETVSEIRAKLARKPQAPALATIEAVNQLAFGKAKAATMTLAKRKPITKLKGQAQGAIGRVEKAVGR